MAVFAALGVVAPAEAAVDYYLEIEGVPGESLDSKFNGAVEVRSFSWGASRTDKSTDLQAFHVTKNVDLASPRLFQRLVQGTTIPSAELLGVKAGETQQIFLRYCLQNVRVTSLDQEDNSGSDGPTEELSLGYGAITLRYSQTGETGGAGQSVFAGWNVTTGQLIATYPQNCGGPLGGNPA